MLVEAAEANELLIRSKAEGYRILYIDEFCTTAETIQTHDWTRKLDYPKVDRNQYHKKTIASILAISEE